MARIDQIAEEVSVLMPMLARRVLLGFFQSIDITQTQLLTIATLAEEAPIRLSGLSKKMNISAPTVTGIVDRLEKLGHVKRVPDKCDRRAINVDLTIKGKNVAKKLRATIKRKWKGLLMQLPKRDQENYVRILGRIQGTIK